MVRQDNSHFNNRKYRFVFRFTYKRCFSQCTYTAPTGDFVVAATASNELAAFRISVGHNDYAADYTTGLLLTPRVFNGIFGCRVYVHMPILLEEVPFSIRGTHFQAFAEGIDAESMEKMSTVAHEKVPDDPTEDPAKRKTVAAKIAAAKTKMMKE